MGTSSEYKTKWLSAAERHCWCSIVLPSSQSIQGLVFATSHSFSLLSRKSIQMGGGLFSVTSLLFPVFSVDPAITNQINLPLSHSRGHCKHSLLTQRSKCYTRIEPRPPPNRIRPGRRTKSWQSPRSPPRHPFRSQRQPCHKR